MSNIQNYTLFYNLTDYPEIFRATYWGSHRDYDNGIKHCIANRNYFVKDKKILKVCKLTSLIEKKIAKKYFESKFEWVETGTTDWADHLEIYKTKDNNIIIIISPYDKSFELYLKLAKLGWMRYNDLYSNGATTYILEINKEELKKYKLPKK